MENVEQSKIEAAQADVRSLVKLQDLCAALHLAREANLHEKIVKYPQHVNRASSIGHPCERYLYYVREAWEQKAPHDTRLQGIFDLGNILEPHIVAEVQLAAQRIGLRFLGQQQAFVDKTANLSGHIDGFLTKLEEPDVKWPVEIKTTNPHTFDQIKSVDDMLNARQHYLRSYYDQLQSYLFMTAQQFGIIVLANKSTWQLRFIPVELNFEYYESVLKKCERINAAIAAKEPPPRHIDFDICSECAFKTICFDGATLQLPTFDSDRLVNAIMEKESNEAGHKAYEAAGKIIKEECERAGGEAFEAGPFFIKRTLRKGYEVKARFQEPTFMNTIKRKDELR